MQFEDEGGERWRRHPRIPSGRGGRAALLVALGCALLAGLASDLPIDGADDALDFAESSSWSRLLAADDGASDAANDEDGNEGPGPTFVFVMGIEGTGHHFISELLGRSPNMMEMEDLGVCSRGGGTKSGELSRMSALFFDNGRNNVSLFSPSRGRAKYADFDSSYGAIVGMLKSIKHKFNERRAQQREEEGRNDGNDENPYHVAINANHCNSPSMMSYPTFLGPDRALQNFNLDVFYSACSDADVECKHLYIYRDPYDVLKSTGKNRHFNDNAYDSVRLYTTVLQQVQSQLMSRPDRNAGCFGFLDAEGNQIRGDWERFGRLFGWESFDEFRAVADEVNTKGGPEVMSDETRASLVPARLGVLMRALEGVHDRVVDYCYSSLNDLEGGEDVLPGLGQDGDGDQLAVSDEAEAPAEAS